MAYWWQKEEKKDSEQQSAEQQTGGQGYWWQRENLGTTIGNKLSDQVNNWLKSSNDYLTNYQKRNAGRKYSYEDAYVKDSGSWRETASKRADELEAERQAILAYMDENKAYISPELRESIRNSLAKGRDTQAKIRNSAVQDDLWWNSFGKDEELLKKYGSAEGVYNYFQRSDGYSKKYEGMTIDEIQKALSGLENGEEKAWLAYNQSSIAKGTYSKNADWGERSQYKTTYRGGEEFNAFSGTYTDTGYDDITYDYINRDDKARDRMLVNDVATNASFLGLDKSYLKEMTDDEIAVYNYLYDPNDPTAANAYLEILLSDLNYRQRETQQKYWADYAKEHPFGSSAFSILMSPVKGLSAIGQIADYTADGTIDQNAGYNKFSYIPSAIREQVSNDIAKSGKWGEVGSWTYQLGMGMGDFLLNSAVSGGSSAVSLALMGSGAMADTVISAKDRGLSDDQAMILGVVSAGAEIITEKFSLDALFKGNMSRGAMKYILTNAFTEGTEEVGSTLINTIADVLVSKDKSMWQMEINDYLAKNPNASESEAFRKVLGDNVLSLGLDFLGGALMGGAMGAGGAGINYVTNAAPHLKVNKDTLKQYGNKTDALIQEGLESDKESDSYYLAQRYQQQVQGKNGKQGKALSGYQIRNLLAANQEQITPKDMKLIQKAAEKRLTELGQTEDVSKVAELATKRATGQNLTRAEKRFLASSEYGARVANELLPKNIESGEYTTGWAEEIGTRQVNAKEYNKAKIEQVRSIIEQMKSTEDPAQYKSLTERTGTEGRFSVSESGKAVVRETGEEIDTGALEVATIGNGRMTFKVGDREVSAEEIDWADDGQSFLMSAISQIEHITPADATAIIRDVVDMSKPLGLQLNAIDEAFTYGFHGYSVEDLKAGEFTKNLSDKQMMSAYELGKAARRDLREAKVETFKKMRTAADAEAEGGTILNETGAKVKVKAIASKDGSKMTLELESGEIVDADKVTLSEEEALIYKAISEMDISAKEANKLLQGYDGSISAEAYASGISEAYHYGRQGVEYKSIDSQGYAVAIPVQARKKAYQMGRKALETGKADSYNSTTNEKESVSDGTGENVHLRRGTQRADGESSDGSVQRVAETPRGVQERYETGRSESSRADSQANEGRVSAADLGIPGGTGARNLTAVSSDYSADTKEATAVAAEQGLEAVFFNGNNLRIEHDGKVIEARACIVGKKIYVRADHTQFTATQLTKHELTHDKIDSGQIDTGNVYDLMVMYYDEAKVKDIIKAYAEAYDMGYDTQEAADAVFVEIVCDSEAGINYFTMEEQAGTPRFMENVNYAILADMNSRDTRGPPADGDVRLSRETRKVNTFLRHFTGEVKAGEYIYLSNIEKATIKSNIKTRFSHLAPDAKRGIVSAHDRSKGYTYHFICNADYSVTVIDVFDDVADRAIIDRLLKEVTGYDSAGIRQPGKPAGAEGHRPSNRSNDGSAYEKAQPEKSAAEVDGGTSEGNRRRDSRSSGENRNDSGADKTRSSQKVKFSREFSLSDINKQINELKEQRRGIMASAEYEQILSKISTAKGEALDAVIQEYGEFTRSSGLYDVTEQLATLEKQAEETRKQQEADYLSNAAAERKAAIEASGLTEAEYDTKQAVKEFGYTPYYYDAGYIVADGKMLNFSGEKGRHFGTRGQDHRAIGILYDDVSGTQAMVKFMNEGNVRIMDESPGLDISTMPTKEQMATIKKYVASKHGEIYLDISDAEGRNVASIEYVRGTSPSIVELDIKEYFEKGKIPEKFEPKFSREFIQAQMTEQEKHLQQVNKALEKDNAKLQEDNQYLKQLLKIQREVTGGTKFTRSSVEAMARQLKTKANANGDTKGLATILNSFYEFIATSKELSWEDVMEQAEAAADWLMDNKRENFVRDEYAQRVLDDLWGRSFYLDDVQKGEAAYTYGSYHAFRRKVLGTATPSDKASMSLDELWKEMAAEHPHYFPAETSSGDQVQGIVDVIETLRTAKAANSEGVFDNSKEMEKRELVHDIYDSFWRVSTLRTVADTKQREINSLKAKHYAKMDQVKRAHKEATKQLEAEYHQRMDTLRAEYKARTEEKIRKVKDANRKSRQNAMESRHKTELRHKIQGVVRELNKLLLSNDKKNHVPESLKKAVADALSLVNMDTVGAEERAARYAALIANETDPDKIDAYTAAMENILRQGEKMGQRLKELRDAYEEIQNSDDPDIANAYDPVISGSLAELSQSIGSTSLRDMSLAQLQDVYDMYKMVLTRVRDANKSLIDSIKATITERAASIVREVQKSGGNNKLRTSVMDPVRNFSWNNLKPVYAMERIGSATMTEAYEHVRAGEDTWAKDVTEARAFYSEKAKKYEYDGWDLEEKHSFKSTSGQEFELTLEQIMSLYAYSKRDQALDHLRLGGFVFDSSIETKRERIGKDGKKHKSILNYKVNTADAHQLSAEILADIVGTLSDDQCHFVDEMQDYLSTAMGAKGNEVTMKMYGVKLFKEKFYFPLKSAKQFLFEQNEVSGEVRIKNSGFTNKTVQKANNPVILNNFMDVWAGHVNDMSMYHAFTLPLEDFNRLLNYNSPKQEGVPPVSVKGTIQNAYSPAAVSYLKQLITDLNGGAMADPRETPAKAMLSKFKKAKVFSSLSVVIQQPSAIGRAFALVHPKYFRATRDGMNHEQLWEELKKYAPVAVIKEMGYFDTNMGRSTLDFIKAKEYSTLKEEAKAIFTDSSYRDEVLSNAPALADEITWCAIWNAVKRETMARNHDLSPRSKEFLDIAGKRFTEVVTKTQVYDSVLARSANMRSKSGLMSMATSFMAEPTTTINMLEDAVLKAKRGHKKYAARAFASVAVSVVLNNALVSLVYAMRDDDEEETFAEKYAQFFVSGMLDDINPLTYYPYLKDMWSILQGFDVERSDMSLVADFADAAKKMVKEATSEDGDLAGALWDMAGAVANIGGIPMQNIRRDIVGALNFIQTLIEDHNGRVTTPGSLSDAISAAVRDALPVVGWLPGESKSGKIWGAIVNGDTAYTDRLKNGYANEDAWNTAVRRALREAYDEGQIDEETTVYHLVKDAGWDGETAVEKVNYWSFLLDWPQYNALTEGDVTKYYDFADPNGIDLDTYAEYCDNVTGGMKKAEVLAVIHDLDISDKQKDALYFANGYAESTLDEAPWH